MKKERKTLYPQSVDHAAFIWKHYCAEGWNVVDRLEVRWSFRKMRSILCFTIEKLSK